MAIWLNEEAVHASLPLSDLMRAMRDALSAFSSGTVIQPLRTVIQWEPHAFLATMPAKSGAIPALGAKLVTVVGSNTRKGLPSHLATILLLDPETGALLALLDGRYITEVRTAAVSAIAAQLLANPDQGVLAILGSGVQARSHLQALRQVYSFSEIRCWSPTVENRERFAVAHGIRASASAEAAVRGATIIALVTDATQPVIQNDWVADGACILSVGACRPDQREMDPVLVARSRVVVDSRTSALSESGDILLGIREALFPPSHVAAELGEVIANPNLGRRNPSEVVLFKSLGLAIEDVAAAHLAYTRAAEQGIGVPLA